MKDNDEAEWEAHFLWNHDIDSHTFCLMMLIDGYANQAKFYFRIYRHYFRLVMVVMEENHRSPNDKIKEFTKLKYHNRATLLEIHSYIGTR